MTEKRFGEFNQKRFIISVELDNSCGIEDLLKNKKYSHFREKDYHKLKIIRDELNELYYENEQLKQALREQLEENGNSYCIILLNEIFDLKYDEWQTKMRENRIYDYIDWEKVLKDKGDVE